LIVRNEKHALVIDDEQQVRQLVSEVLATDGWIVSNASSAEEAFAIADSQSWVLIVCDVMLGGPDGYEVLRHFVERSPQSRFVLMTGQGSAAGALEATAIGAYDYLIKPFSIEDILHVSRTISQQHKARSGQSKNVNKPSQASYRSDLQLIGSSPKFVECLKLVGRVSRTDLPVLITGESGTGKEVVAKAIHQRSNRATNNFVPVNCGAIPVELIESELFGHSKGSFTGADRERIGLWEEADGGTIFLDEITETGPLFQVKLLRALQQHEIRRIGSNTNISVDVRVIAATNRDIDEEVRTGRFRQDLMYRLNVVTLNLPPLRERREDIFPLAEHFAAKAVSGKGSIKFSTAAVDILNGFDWNGNIRELENAVLHAVSLADDVVYPEHLPAKLQNFTGPSLEVSSPTATPSSQNDEPKTYSTLAEIEAKYVADVLAHTEGNKQAAARILNIDRKTLGRIINRRNGS
jgi:two-component system response regulator AtoC